MKQITPFLLLLLAACTKSGTITSTSTIIPVSENNMWAYYDSSFTNQLIGRYIDTLTFTGSTHIDGKRIYLCNATKPLLFGIDFNALRIDSSSIYFINTSYNSEFLYFRKTSSIDTISVTDYFYSNPAYVTFPRPDTLIQMEKIKGVKYHIGYPDQIEVNGNWCYKNENVTVGAAGNVLFRQSIYVSPKKGIVKVEYFGMMPGRWFPEERMFRVYCLNLM